MVFLFCFVLFCLLCTDVCDTVQTIQKTPEALKSMTREEVIAATVSFQQHYTAAPNAASQASASLPASSVVDGSSQTVPEASVPAPTPSTNMV